MLKHLWLYVLLQLPDRNTELSQLSQAWGLLYFAFLDTFFSLGGTFLMSSCSNFLGYFIQSVAFHKSVCHHKSPVVVLASIYRQCFRSTSTYQVKSVLPYVTTHCISSKTIIFICIKIPPFLWYINQLFTSVCTSGHLHYAYEMSIYSLLWLFLFPSPGSSN